MTTATPRHSFPPAADETPKPYLVACYMCGTPVPPTNRFSDDVFAICPVQDNLPCLDREKQPQEPQEAPEPLVDPPIAKTVRASRRAKPETTEGDT